MPKAKHMEKDIEESCPKRSPRKRNSSYCLPFSVMR